MSFVFFVDVNLIDRRTQRAIHFGKELKSLNLLWLGGSAVGFGHKTLAGLIERVPVLMFTYSSRDTSTNSQTNAKILTS